ncbi:GNAT family N-acetyltransferase [Neoroseomonas marina]|uniref:GNAT family N-acetyltransferase n=1 Tax=Neoroseomonas marina TaxID=1232220 RepID=UPI001B7D6C56
MGGQAAIGAAGDADAPALARIFLAARAAALPGLREVHSAEEVAAWLASALMARQRVRMATVAGVPVGYVGFGLDAARGPMVFHLYIAPGWWRRGIGTRLLTEAEAALGPRLSLFCIKRNTAARAFYERHGFRVAATSDGAGTEEGEPDILFARDDGSPDRDDKVGATDERNA